MVLKQAPSAPDKKRLPHSDFQDSPFFDSVKDSLQNTLHERQEDAAGDDRTQLARCVRAHRVHQDKVPIVFFKRHLRRDPSRHRERADPDFKIIRLKSTLSEKGAMIERESSDLEYKEMISNSFLKTVSAFANYSGGKIIFGINDNGETIGLAGDLIQHCLSIENMINDNLRPVPRFRLQIHQQAKTIELNVSEGSAKPYMVKNKA